MLLGVVLSINAKSTVTTLWEGDASGEVIISADKFSSAKADDVIRIYFNCTEDKSLHVVYMIGVNAYAFNGISEWPWCTTSMSKTDLSINATDLTTLKAYGICIYGDAEKLGITKVTLISEITPTSVTELLDANWTASWTAKVFSEQASAKIGDVIRVKYYGYKDESTEWPWVQFYFMDGSQTNLIEPIAASKQKNEEQVFDYEITTPEVMEKIQSNGFTIKGAEFVLTSVKLLTYADSYEGVTVTIGADGIRTWSHAKNLDFSETGITAYYASAVETGQVTLTSTATTWNYCGYILRGDEDTYIAKVVPDAQASYPTGNLLKGNVGENTIAASITGTYHYVFAKDNEDHIGFYKLTTDHTLGANKAYLETPTDITPGAGSAPAIHLVFEEENGATALEQFEANDEVLKFIENGQLFIRKNGVTYDLMGRTVK